MADQIGIIRKQDYRKIDRFVRNSDRPSTIDTEKKMSIKQDVQTISGARCDPCSESEIRTLPVTFLQTVVDSKKSGQSELPWAGNLRPK
jgi:hypothetical protein